MCEKDYIWNPNACACENDDYLESIIDDSVITCDEIISTSETGSINFNDEKSTHKMKYYYVLYTLLLVIILVLIIGAISQ